MFLSVTLKYLAHLSRKSQLLSKGVQQREVGAHLSYREEVGLGLRSDEGVRMGQMQHVPKRFL
jgi:hypothetical protein